MQEEINRIIELIDYKIKELTHAKKVLIEQFGIKRNESVKTQFSTSEGGEETKPPTRRAGIIAAFEKHGPMSKKELIEKTGFPRGTVAFTLNDKETFEPKEGKWYLKNKLEN